MLRLLPLLLLAACTSPGDDTGATETIEGCRAGDPRPDDVRHVLVSHPYAANADQADAWEALALAPDGTLTRGAAFAMGRGLGGPVRFAPDGSLAVAVHDDGTLGVVLLDDEGTPDVVTAAFADDGYGDEFYASDVVFDPGGERLWVVDGNWENNGGGVYAVDLDCETGEPSAAGLVLPSKLGSHLIPVAGGRHVLVADEALGSGPGEHVHLLDLSGPTRLDGADLWPDDEAIVGGAALAGDGGYVLVGDYSQFSGLPNRVAAARLDGDTLSPVQVLPGIEDPVAIASWGRATLVASGFGDALVRLSYAHGAAAPFTNAGQLPTTGGSSQLPAAIAVTSAPDGDGWLLVAEVSAIRRVRATPSGTTTDLGPFSFGAGYPAIVGSVGASP